MESSRAFADSIDTTLTEHSEYLKAIHILYQEVNGKDAIPQKYVSVVKAKLTKMHHSPLQANILAEAFDLIIDNGLEFEEIKNYDREFLDYAKTVTERITNENYFEYYIQQQLQRLDDNTSELQNV